MTFAAEVDELLRNLAKPPGSLGLLEAQARQVFLAWGNTETAFRPKHIIFAADNGITRSGAVQQLAEITYMQSRQMVEGVSAVTCFCRCNGIPYEVVDVGIDSDDGVGIDRKIRRGTRDFAVEPAMTAAELERALAIGGERAAAAKRDGYTCLSFGEMGIGNTTTSAAVLTALLPDHTPWLAGYGSARGNYRLLRHKEELVRQGLLAYPQIRGNALEALRCVGGYDLAALCGAMTACAELRLPFFIDGFITAAALACAVTLEPSVRAYALLSHLSREPGMAAALRYIGRDENEVILHGGMSLGEGSGAVLVVVLLRSMLYAVRHMATLDGINAAAARRRAERDGKGRNVGGNTDR